MHWLLTPLDGHGTFQSLFLAKGHPWLHQLPFQPMESVSSVPDLKLVNYVPIYPVLATRTLNA